MSNTPTDPNNHLLANIPPEVYSLFEEILHYRVDPGGIYYGVTKDLLKQRIDELSQLNVAAIDSEYRYERKGHMYDPVLQSFVQGAGGRLSTWDPEENTNLPIVLRGITKRK